VPAAAAATHRSLHPARHQPTPVRPPGLPPDPPQPSPAVANYDGGYGGTYSYSNSNNAAGWVPDWAAPVTGTVASALWTAGDVSRQVASSLLTTVLSQLPGATSDQEAEGREDGDDGGSDGPALRRMQSSSGSGALAWLGGVTSSLSRTASSVGEWCLASAVLRACPPLASAAACAQQELLPRRQQGGRVAACPCARRQVLTSPACVAAALPAGGALPAQLKKLHRQTASWGRDDSMVLPVTQAQASYMSSQRPASEARGRSRSAACRSRPDCSACAVQHAQLQPAESVA